MTRPSVALLAVAVVLGPGCGDPTGSPGATLVVTTSTSGIDPDLDGYIVVLDDQAGRPLARNSTLTLSDLEPGEHQVALDGRSPNCAVTGDNPMTVSVNPGTTVRVTFYVTCAAATGALTIHTATTGDGQDPDGYSASIDGGSGRRLTPTGSLTVSGLPPGDHVVEVADVITNCRLEGEPSRTVRVEAGATVDLALSFICVGRTLRITTTTTGPAPDPNGYTVAVDGGVPEAIGVAASLDVGGLVDGEHTVTLSDLAPFCVVAEDPRTIRVAETTAPVSFEVFCAGPPRDGGLILFNGEVRSEVHVFVMHPDGTGQVDLTPNASGYSAHWSPDRSRIVFETYRNGANEVFVMHADGSHQARLAAGRSPAWSPDGSRIAFIGSAGLTIMNADGSHPRPLQTGRQPDSPAWSPDGSAIAYTEVNPSRCTLILFDLFCAQDIHVLNADGSGGHQVTHATDALTSSLSPAWSPDGTAIAFTRGAPLSGGGGELFLVAPDGTQLSQLTSTSTVTEAFPVWSPDGRALAFAQVSRTTPGADYDLALIARQGGAPVTLLAQPGEQLPTSWR
jgi:hypothetical protein